MRFEQASVRLFVRHDAQIAKDPCDVRGYASCSLGQFPVSLGWPLVIAIKECDPRSAGFFDAAMACSGYTSVLLSYDPDLRPVPLLDRLGGSVCRSVVDDDDFSLRQRLGQHTVNGALYVGATIKSWNNGGYIHECAFRCLKLLESCSGPWHKGGQAD